MVKTLQVMREQRIENPSAPLAINYAATSCTTRGATMRGHVRKRRTWEFIVDIGPHPHTGKRRQKSKSAFNTKK
jgi:hypothetical protein